MNAYLITNSKNYKQREIWITKDEQSALAKSKIKNPEIRKICDALTYLKNEKSMQRIYLGDELPKAATKRRINPKEFEDLANRVKQSFLEEEETRK